MKKSRMTFLLSRVRTRTSTRTMKRLTHLRQVYVIKAPTAQNKTLELLVIHHLHKKPMAEPTVEVSPPQISH